MLTINFTPSRNFLFFFVSGFHFFQVNRAVWFSSGFAAIMYFTFGFLLASAYPNVHTDNILQELLSDENTDILTKFFIYS